MIKDNLNIKEKVTENKELKKVTENKELTKESEKCINTMKRNYLKKLIKSKYGYKINNEYTL
tara:strand:- start:74 stop:259 length:186 start_codon:yes stop_codon:yes gene_type:complete